MDNELDLLNKEVKERVIELEEQMRKHYTEEEWFNYLTIKNEFEKNSNILKKLKDNFKKNNEEETRKQYLEEIEAYNSCLSTIKNTVGIRCKHCGSYKVIPYYYGILYPSIIESKYIKIDKDYKYGGSEKTEDDKSYYCNDCNKDFNIY